MIVKKLLASVKFRFSSRKLLMSVPSTRAQHLPPRLQNARFCLHPSARLPRMRAHPVGQTRHQTRVAARRVAPHPKAVGGYRTRHRDALAGFYAALPMHAHSCML
jgi:hypothetical protein